MTDGNFYLVDLGSGAERQEDGCSLLGKVKTAQVGKGHFVYRLHLDMQSDEVRWVITVYGRKIETVFGKDKKPFAILVRPIPRYVHQMIGCAILKRVLAKGVSPAPVLKFETEDLSESAEMMPYEAMPTSIPAPLPGDMVNWVFYGSRGSRSKEAEPSV